MTLLMLNMLNIIGFIGSAMSAGLMLWFAWEELTKHKFVIKAAFFLVVAVALALLSVALFLGYAA